MKRFLFILFILFAPIITNCNPSTLDTSFNGTSFTVNSIVNKPFVKAVAIQSDGKSVVTGNFQPSSEGRTFIARYNVDLTLDSSFGQAGHVITSINNANGIAITSDNKIIIVGQDFPRDTLIARYNTDGSLDTSFGTNGFTTTVIGVFSQATAVTLQSDGKIVTTGYGNSSFSSVSQPEQSFVARYNTNGSLDTSFGSGLGYATTSTGAINQSQGLVIDEIGRITITGSFSKSEYVLPQAFIARFSSNGFIDNSLSYIDLNGDSDDIIRGSAILSIEARTYATSIAIQKDENHPNPFLDKIIIAGYALTRNGWIAFVARLNNRDGSFDTSFGNGLGYVTTLVGSDSFIEDMLILPNRNIITAGYNEKSNKKYALITSYYPDGSLNTNFNQVGYLSLAIESNVQSTCITQFNENVITAGHTDDKVAIGHQNTNGHALTQIESDSKGYSILTQSDNKILVAGYVNQDNIDQIVIARYLENGYLDASFSSDGYTLTPIGSTDARAYQAALQSDGKIVIAGIANDQMIVARYLTDGTLDPAFNNAGTPGYAISSIGTSSIAYSLAIQSDGKIVITGEATISGVQQIIVARYLSTGLLDSTFNSVGYTTTPIGTSTIAQGVAIQSNGKIITAGYTTTSGVNKIVVACYATNGILDTTFGTNGYTTTLIETSCKALSIVLQPNNNILITGSVQDSGIQKIIIARYTPTGTLDTTFGTNGYTITEIGSDSFANFITTQSDQKILVTGQATVEEVSQICLARYTPTGQLDTAFNDLGYTTTKNGNNSEAFSLTIEENQKIIVTGYANITGLSHITIVGYLGNLAATTTTDSSVINNYGTHSKHIHNFLNTSHHTKVITDLTARKATFDSINNVIASYISQYASQSSFNYISNLGLTDTPLNNGQTTLTKNHPDSTSEINTGLPHDK